MEVEGVRDTQEIKDQLMEISATRNQEVTNYKEKSKAIQLSVEAASAEEVTKLRLRKKEIVQKWKVSSLSFFFFSVYFMLCIP